ncbi:hypothetical protein ACFU99_25870, partial [Streptomyces sp. NPDC057654]
AGALLPTAPPHAAPPERGAGGGAGTYATVDYQAVGHVVTGRVGQTVPVELGVRNGGPDVGRGAGSYEITPPEGTTITSGTGSCGAKGTRTYVCALGATLRPGAVDTLRFDVRIDKKVEGAEGEIRVVDGGDGEATAHDPHPENDAAAIRTAVEDVETVEDSVTTTPSPPTATLADTGPQHTPLLLAIATGALALGITTTTIPSRPHHHH